MGANTVYGNTPYAGFQILNYPYAGLFDPAERFIYTTNSNAKMVVTPVSSYTKSAAMQRGGTFTGSNLYGLALDQSTSILYSTNSVAGIVVFDLSCVKPIADDPAYPMECNLPDLASGRVAGGVSCAQECAPGLMTSGVEYVCSYGTMLGNQTCVTAPDCAAPFPSAAPTGGDAGTCGVPIAAGGSCSINCNGGFTLSGAAYDCSAIGVRTGSQSCVANPVSSTAVARSSTATSQSNSGTGRSSSSTGLTIQGGVSTGATGSSGTNNGGGHGSSSTGPNAPCVLGLTCAASSKATAIEAIALALGLMAAAAAAGAF